MSDVIQFPFRQWQPDVPAAVQAQALQALERGNVVHLPQLPFELDDAELAAIRAAVPQGRKNLSYDPARGALQASDAGDETQRTLTAMMARYGKQANMLLHSLFPRYTPGLQQRRTSFRPVEIAGRVSSWRKDDTRLHVDAFPSSPVQGKRILRVFANVNPEAKGRHWRLGEPFENVAQRFLPAIPKPLPGSATLMQALHITKSRRSAYDHYMLHLHDTMKADMRYQAEVPQTEYEFMPGGTWMVYTDQASHAAMRGQHALEQTYLLDVEAMGDPAQSPLAVLQKMLGRPLL